MHNASCGTTVVKIDVHYAPSFTIKREPQFGIPIIEGMTVMLGKQMEYFCAKAKIKWEEIKSFFFLLSSMMKVGVLASNMEYSIFQMLKFT